MKIRKKPVWLLVFAVLVALAGILALAATVWYRHMLSPVDSANSQAVHFKIEERSSAGDIAKKLEDNKLIRSEIAFTIYLRLNGGGGNFRAGTYKLTQQLSVSEIVNRLTGGVVDEKEVTFYPEAVLEDPSQYNTGRNVVDRLVAAGYSIEEARAAVKERYEGEVFAGRPDGQGIEGYVWGETYFIPSDYTAKQAVQRAIDEFGRIIKENDLEAKFKARGLTLYQGITLASIVQKESKGCGHGATVCEDQRQIASVFYNRLQANMPLGSDVTYHYAADQSGVARSYTLDSPYNTRLYQGLPPGPIAVPGISALNAVADPATTDYLYFLSGDDNETYFATTEADHQRNIENHCHKKCQLP